MTFDSLPVTPGPEQPGTARIFYLSAAAAHVIAADYFDPPSPAHQAVLAMWCDLTGLGPDEAVAYARRVHADPSTVTAAAPY